MKSALSARMNRSEQASTADPKTREGRLRRKYNRLGYRLLKSRTRKLHINNRGGYQLIKADRNLVVWGDKFDLSIDAAEEIVSSQWGLEKLRRW